MPMSASLASPGPFTAQPITATLISLFIFLHLSSTLLARPIKSIEVLPQVGQDTNSIPNFLRPKSFNIALATLTSSTVEPVKDTLIVSPIPIASIAPIPTADLIVPDHSVPDSVIPK